MAVVQVAESDLAVLREINQRTLVGGAEIDTKLIAEQLSLSRSQVGESVVRGRAYVQGCPPDRDEHL